MNCMKFHFLIVSHHPASELLTLLYYLTILTLFIGMTSAPSLTKCFKLIPILYAYKICNKYGRKCRINI